ncbi:DMT family transporter [Azospirillum sp.]|uniref:DMT family transporter n=1 Tax=Azospirillum sp. TaxID=34012 RepID=UPI003D70DDFF
MSPLDLGVAMLVVALWGINFGVAKVALLEFPPLFLMALRFFIVAALLLPFVRMPRGKLLGVLALSTILGTIHFPMMFNGIKGIDAATASVVAQLQVPFASLLAAVVFKDRLGWKRAVGMLVAFAGVLLIAGEPRLGDSLGALGLVVGGSFAFAAANVQIKRLGDIDGFALNAWMGLFAAPQLLVLSALFEHGQWEAVRNASWAGWGSLLYIAVLATIVAYGLWYRLMRRYDVNQAVPFMLLIPLFGVLSGVVLLGEPVTWTLAVGGLMTVAGVGIIVLRRPRVVVNDKVTNLT